MIIKKKTKTKSSSSKKVKDSLKGKTTKKKLSKKRKPKTSVAEKRVAKKSAGHRSSRNNSKRIIDPEAMLEAKRYDNPVASRTLLLNTIKENGMMTLSSVYETLQVPEQQQEGVSRHGA